MTMTRQDVLALARLAQLELSPDAVESMARDLDEIIGYIDKLGELDTEDVDPSFQVLVDRAPLRPDEVRSGLGKQEALHEAPRSDDAGFLVPGFVDES